MKNKILYFQNSTQFIKGCDFIVLLYYFTNKFKKTNDIIITKMFDFVQKMINNFASCI